MTDLIADLRQKLAENALWLTPPLAVTADRLGNVVDAEGSPMVDLVREDYGDLAVCWSPDAPALIVAAVNALPGLLDELEAARAELEARRTGCGSMWITHCQRATVAARAANG